MAKVQDTGHLIIWNASSHDLVRTILVEIWIIIVELSNFDQKLTFILGTPIRWDFICHQVVENMSIPWHFGDREEVFIREVVINGGTLGEVVKLKPRQMVCHNILNSFLVLDRYIKLLQ